MTARASIDELVRELQKLMRQKHSDASLSAWLQCDPKVVVPGTAITVRARIFAGAEVLAELKPVLGCEDIPGFRPRPFAGRKRQTGFGDYVAKLPSDDLEVDKTYHLTLHPQLGADTITRSTVYVVRRGIAAAVRRQVREIISGPPSRKPSPPRRRRRRR